MDRTVALINGINRKHTHTSGVISFAQEDAPTREELFDVIKDFKDHFFAGLEPDQFDITFVRHSHLDREEIHFVTPRMELTSGKELNISPPTESHAYKERFVKAWNYEKGWADPSDPDRQREISHQPVKPGHGFKLMKHREDVLNFVKDGMSDGTIFDRPSLIAALKNEGVKINRESRDYISIENDEGVKIRMKGQFFKENWTYSPFEIPDPKPFRNPEDDAVRSKKARSECLAYRERRAASNGNRYPRPAEMFTPDIAEELTLLKDIDPMYLSLHPAMGSLNIKEKESENVRPDPARDEASEYCENAGRGAERMLESFRSSEDESWSNASELLKTRTVVQDAARFNRDTAEANRHTLEPNGVIGRLVAVGTKLISTVCNFFSSKKVMSAVDDPTSVFFIDRSADQKQPDQAPTRDSDPEPGF